MPSRSRARRTAADGQTVECELQTPRGELIRVLVTPKQRHKRKGRKTLICVEIEEPAAETLPSGVTPD